MTTDLSGALAATRQDRSSTVDPPADPGRNSAADNAFPNDQSPGGAMVEASSITAPSRILVPLPRAVRRLGGPVVLLAGWQFLSGTGLLSDQVLAPPTAVLRAGWDLARTGELGQDVVASLIRAGQGLAIGVTAGLVLAVLAGLFRLGDDLVDSGLQVLRALPPLGLLPLVIIWFGVGEAPKIALVAWASLFPVYVNTYSAIRGVDNRLAESARTFGLGRSGLIRHVVLPGAIPGFLVGLRFALTYSWLVLIIAEQINATTGIGYLMNQAQGWYRTDIIVLGLLLYGGFGLATDSGVRLLERKLLRWRRGFSGA